MHESLQIINQWITGVVSNLASKTPNARVVAAPQWDRAQLQLILLPCEFQRGPESGRGARVHV